jgi:hypothetical protein
MKTTIISLILILFAKVTLAQKELLAFDEHNQYIYYQVVDMPGHAADTLYIRGSNFLKSMVPKIKKISAANANTLSGQGKFLTFGGVSILKHANGEISYTINIECKDGKYRYWLTGFTFTPYQRDRYGNFVPQQGIDVQLETALSKYSKKDVDNYLDETGAFCKNVGDRLKFYMLNAPAPKKEETIKKTVTDKW